MEIKTNGYLAIEDVDIWTIDELEAIANFSEIAYDDVVLFLRYNVISYSQLSLLTSTPETTLRNMTKGTFKKHTNERVCKLDEVNCFPDASTGKLFVEMNQKCINFIKEKVGI